MATPMVTPMVTRPPDRWWWGDASAARRARPDAEGEAGYRLQLRGREVTATVAEMREVYEMVALST
jgi:hypothetical protein